MTLCKALAPIKEALDRIAGRPPLLAKTHLQQVAPLINRAASIELLNGILADERALAEIAARSYTHTLGFRKLVLLDPGFDLPEGKRGFGYQLRLHIWDPADQSGVPLVEAMHEHAFDFVSHMLIGEMENQCYRIEALASDAPLLQRVLANRESMPAGSIATAGGVLERLEAVRLSAFGSQQSTVESTTCSADLASLAMLLGVSVEDAEAAVSLQGRYQSVASSVQGGGYVHRLQEMVRLIPHLVLRLKSGDTYFHPHQFAHRLYIRAGQANATMIVTTPVSQEAKGGSFQRPWHATGDEVNYARRIYSTAELEVMLRTFREQLLATPPETETTSRLHSVE